MIGLCTDSNSQMPIELVERFGVQVVPVTVVVDNVDYLEGVDLEPDEFYARYAGGRRPAVALSQPSAGQFAVAYDELAARGCTQILSVHTSLATCPSMHAARLAAHNAPVAVRVVDTATARFGVSCCVWAAGAALAAGADLDEAAAIAESLAPSIGNVFIVDGLDLTAGRAPDTKGSVLTLHDNRLEVVELVDSMADAVNAMARYTLRRGDRLRVAVGTAHRDTEPIATALVHAVGETAAVEEVIRFRIGPSVGVETGPGTVGCVMYPA
ncbi:MAG: DegV family protein [Ilumatobacteraceae bacterium]